MIRVRRGRGSASRGTTALAPPSVAVAAGPDEIIRDFADPYLELVRLLREASEIEHALLVQYLYAAYSIKPDYELVRGFEFASTSDLLGVAIQEMHHLGDVNRMLVALGAAPNLVRQDFPYESDIYPFELNLEPLSRTTLARYVYTEASAKALDPDDPDNADPATQEFLAQLDAVLGGVEPNRLGSLYDSIIGVTQEVSALNLPGVGDLSTWLTKLAQIKSEGEDGHFAMFVSVFMGTHVGLAARPDAWTLDPDDPAYPAFDIGVNRSALEGHPNQIADPTHRKLGWLADLHYWLVLGLLDLGYRYGIGTASAQAERHMNGALHLLGLHMAPLGVGLPFDPLSMGYAPGVDLAGSVRVLRRLTLAAKAVTDELAGALPPDYPMEMSTQTLATLDGIAPEVEPGGGGSGGGGPVEPSPQEASDFWFDLDDRFLINRPPEVNQALSIIRGPNFILGRFDARRQAGQFPAGFVTDVTPLRAGLETISILQLEIVDRYFGDVEGLRVAFEHFGCGDLFDDRRDPGMKVHMMDSSGPANPPIGYHRWHAIIRAMTLLGIDADRWAAIDRLLGLAWAIHAEAQPLQDTVNPQLPEARLVALRAHWLTRSDDEMDAAFSVFPFPPPVP